MTSALKANTSIIRQSPVNLSACSTHTIAMGDASVMMDITLLMDFASNVPMEAGITKSLRNVMTSAQGHIKFILLLGVFVKMATS